MRRLISLLLTFGVCQAATPVLATETELESVVVLGSRIARINDATISPVVTLTQADIQMQGLTNVEDAIKRLPQVFPFRDRTSNNPGNGQAQVDLRGLGPNRTLVLRDGRRMVPSGVSGAINFNDIPIYLVERIDVLTGGASSVYGSDAVTGAINVVMRDGFEGVRLTTQFEQYDAGDGFTRDFNLGFGKTFDSEISVSGFLAHQDRTPVFQDDRAISAMPLWENFETGEIEFGGSYATPAGVIGFPPAFLPGYGLTEFVTFNDDTDPVPLQVPEGLYNWAPVNYLQLPQKRDQGMLFLDLPVGQHWLIELDLEYSKSKVEQSFAPTPIFAFLAMNIDHPLLTPSQRDLLQSNYNFGGNFGNFFLARRTLDIGPRQGLTETEHERMLIAISGDTKGWLVEAYASHAEYSTRVDLENAVYQSRLQQGLLADPATMSCFDPAGGCVPITLFGAQALTAEMIDFVRARDIYTTVDVTESVLSLNATRDIWELPAGSVAIAVGSEWRELKTKRVTADALFDADILGFRADSNVSGSFDIAEIYAEALIPLLSSQPGFHTFNLELGARYSKYSSASDDITWKAGIDWSLTENLRIRAMRQRAVRAPNVNELYRQPIEETAYPAQNDFCSASNDPLGNGFKDLCVGQGIAADQVGVFEANRAFPSTSIYSSNPDLDPEVAQTLTAGVVWQPTGTDSFSLSVDYYDIELSDAIESVSNVLGLCSYANNAGSEFCQLISRHPSGNIEEVRFPNMNVASFAAEGIDLSLHWETALPQALAIGESSSLQLDLFINHNHSLRFQTAPNVPELECSGRFGNDCRTAPERKLFARLSYQSGPWDISLAWQWIDTMSNDLNYVLEQFQQPQEIVRLDELDSRSYLDIGVQYAFSDNFRIRTGISNVLDEKPPLAANYGEQANTFPAVYDTFGPRYFLALDMGW